MNELDLDFSELFSDDAKLVLDDDTSDTDEIENADDAESSLNDVDDIEEKGNKKKIEFTRGTDDVEAGDDDTEEDIIDAEINTPSSKNNDDSSGSFALAFAKFQQDEGVIPDLNEEELNKIINESGEIEALRYLLNKQRDYIYEDAKSIYAADKEELKAYFELKDAGVDSELAKKLAHNKKQFATATDEDVEEDEDFRREILTSYFKETTSFSESRIKKQVDNIFNVGDDIDEAIDALAELKIINARQIEEAKKEEIKKEESYRESIKQAQENFKNFVLEQDEFIKGIKVNKPTKEKIIKMVLEPAAKDVNGNPLSGVWAERAKDPQRFDAYLAYHIVNGTFWGNLDKIKSKVKTDVTTKFEEALRVKGQSLGGKVSRTTDKNASLLEDFLNM